MRRLWARGDVKCKLLFWVKTLPACVGGFGWTVHAELLHVEPIETCDIETPAGPLKLPVAAPQLISISQRQRMPVSSKVTVPLRHHDQEPAIFRRLWSHFRAAAFTACALLASVFPPDVESGCRDLLPCSHRSTGVQHWCLEISFGSQSAFQFIPVMLDGVESGLCVVFQVLLIGKKVSSSDLDPFALLKGKRSPP